MDNTEFRTLWSRLQSDQPVTDEELYAALEHDANERGGTLARRRSQVLDLDLDAIREEQKPKGGLI